MTTIDYVGLDYRSVNYTDDTFAMEFVNLPLATVVGTSIVELSDEIDEETKLPRLVIASGGLSVRAVQDVHTDEESFGMALLLTIVASARGDRLPEFLTTLGELIGPEAKLPMNTKVLMVVWNDKQLEWNFASHDPGGELDQATARVRAALATILHIWYHIVVEKDPTMIACIEAAMAYENAAGEQKIKATLKRDREIKRATFKVIK